MARFRPRKRESAQERTTQLLSRRKQRERRERRRQWIRQQAAQWALLQGISPTRAAKARLASLIARMTSHDRRSRESALAELELATLLIRAGFGVEILPESHSKTADLECSLGASRIYVEVTALVGSFRRPPPPFHARLRRLECPMEDSIYQVLLARLVARITKKARQLDHYTGPVILAASVPQPDPAERVRSPAETHEIDLKHLAGTMTLVLGRLPDLSAVLLTLWDVDPLPAPSAIRLANVHLVERSRHQGAYPRVRMLILNPVATCPLKQPEVLGLKQLL